ncbi:MAG: hypothetical protein M0Q12_05120 [Synergistaceae bacterium]|jgi:hypothetical protein|nr:hypothetical protein [Synergistaceae bacterium]
MSYLDEQIDALDEKVSILEKKVASLEKLLWNKYPLMPSPGTNPDDVLDVIRKWEVGGYEV